MPGHSRVVIVRLREGGLLMIAPASVLPWPQLLSRNARHLQAVGLRRAIEDPAALSSLRREYPRLLGLPAARGGARLSDHELVQAYVTAAQRDLLTVIYGHAEASGGERPAGVQQKLALSADPEVQRQVRAIGLFADPPEPLPAPGAPLPGSRQERVTWATARAAGYLAPAEYPAFEAYFRPQDLGVTVGCLLIWGARHTVGAGFVVDASLFAHAFWRNGFQALKAMDLLKRFFDLTRNPTGWGELDAAAQSLAVALGALGRDTFGQLLRQASDTALVRGGAELDGAPQGRGRAAGRV